MLITEKHLQEIYDRLIKLKIKEDDDYNGFIFGIGAFRMELELILKARTEEDLKKADEFANAAMKIFYDDSLTNDEKTEKIVALAEKDSKRICQK